MYTYCGNNPIIFADYFGFSKIAIIYENGFWPPKSEPLGFPAFAYIALLITMTSDDIVPLPFTSADEFVDAWSSLDSSYDTVIIIVHGYTSGGGIWCRDGDICCSGNSTYHFSDLPPVDLHGRIVLYSCHSTLPDHNGDTVAQAFANLSGSPVVGAAGVVTITPLGGTLEDGDSWTITEPNIPIYSGGGGGGCGAGHAVMMIQ